jgi:hypothetical protein
MSPTPGVIKDSQGIGILQLSLLEIHLDWKAITCKHGAKKKSARCLWQDWRYVNLTSRRRKYFTNKS